MIYLSVLSFRKVNETNEQEVRKVSLKPNQTAFIESVDECLAEAQEYPSWQPVAIYSDESVFGFAMYGSFGPNRHTWIDRIIIDQKYQGQGLGRKAMEGLIEMVSEEYDVDVLYLSIVEENEVAYKLYTSLGFEYMEDEEEPNGELIFKIKIDKGDDYT